MIPEIHYLPGKHRSDFVTSKDQILAGRREARVRPRSVLVVDDNSLVRRIIGEAFTHEGDFEICGEAQDGRDAIEKAQSLHPQLVIMDASMPVLNGLKATRALKQIMPGVHVIIFSLYGTGLENEAMSAGAEAVISKTDALRVLIGKARQLLEKKVA